MPAASHLTSSPALSTRTPARTRCPALGSGTRRGTSASRCLQLSEQHCAPKSLEVEFQFRVFLRVAGPGRAQRGPGRAAAEIEAASLPLALRLALRLAPAGIVPVHQALHLRPSRSPSRLGRVRSWHWQLRHNQLEIGSSGATRWRQRRTVTIRIAAGRPRRTRRAHSSGPMKVGLWLPSVYKDDARASLRPDLARRARRGPGGVFPPASS
jgi:hypothetical protein